MRRHMKSKVCLCGEGGVGKTSTILRFVQNEFDQKYLTTIGTRVSKKVVVADYEDVDLQVEVNMVIWDIMGQRDYLDILKTTYFYGAEGIIAISDMTRRSTLNALTNWIDAMNEDLAGIPMIVLGNKSDLADDIEFGPDELAEFAKPYGAGSYVTSAKTGENVEQAFHDMARTLGRKALEPFKPGV